MPKIETIRFRRMREKAVGREFPYVVDEYVGFDLPLETLDWVQIACDLSRVEAYALVQQATRSGDNVSCTDERGFTTRA